MKYVAKMNSWVHARDYPISKSFLVKSKALEYIKRAIDIYPYIKITLYKYTNDGTETKIKTYTIREWLK